MRIDVPSRNVTLGSLNAGETFKYGEHYYMKTQGGYMSGGCVGTCVSLDDGRIYSLGLSCDVIKIPLKVVLDS